MIPIQLIKLIEKQLGNVHRTDRQAVKDALFELRIPLESEFAVFFLNYVITLFNSNNSSEELCDLVEPTNEILLGTKFVHEVWELPDIYICISTIQSEGAYLYNRNTGEVLDFNLATRDSFLTAQQCQKWKGFFEFMTWYLDEDKINFF